MVSTALLEKKLRGDGLMHPVIASTQKSLWMKEFDVAEHELCHALLPRAASFAHIPLSGFQVGAIAKGDSGNLYLGANLEFPRTAIAHTIHAEQAAFTNAWMNGEQGISDIFVTATPCGHCRQFLNELDSSSTLKIWLGSKRFLLKSLLPEDFGPADLGVSKGLMDNNVPERCLTLADAYSRSYAPYTHSRSAVKITTNSDNIYFGSYVENAAFNPSLPPLQSALIMALLNQEDLKEIKVVELMEASTNTLIQHEAVAHFCSTIIPGAHFRSSDPYHT